MRPRSARARAVVGAGALFTTTLAVGTAWAQQPDESGATPATAAAAPAPTAATTLTVTKRRLNVRAGRRAVVAGRLLPAHAGRTVTLERRTARGWKALDRARTSGAGRYVLAHRVRSTDIAALRVRFAGDAGAAPAKRRAGRLRVFRPALASWYGPGLYGNALSCGGRLSPGTVGVAHKTLPCGTRLVLRKGSRLVRARVIDRGPYVGAREFDLTAATKQRLGFGSTGRVWVAHS